MLIDDFLSKHSRCRCSFKLAESIEDGNGELHTIGCISARFNNFDFNVFCLFVLKEIPKWNKKSTYDIFTFLKSCTECSKNWMEEKSWEHLL